MLESIEKSFSIFFRFFVLVVVFCCTAWLIIWVMEVIGVESYLSPLVYEALLLSLSVTATYFLVKFLKPHFDKIYKGE